MVCIGEVLRNEIRPQAPQQMRQAASVHAHAKQAQLGGWVSDERESRTGPLGLCSCGCPQLLAISGRYADAKDESARPIRDHSAGASNKLSASIVWESGNGIVRPQKFSRTFDLSVWTNARSPDGR